MSRAAAAVERPRPDGRPAGTRARRGRATMLGLLGLLYLSVIGAGFLGPNDPVTQNRDVTFAPPTRLHVVDRGGTLHWRPFVYPLVRRAGTLDDYDEDRSRPFPVRLLVRDLPAGGGPRGRVHLFGTDSPTPMFVLGSDEFGRDLFTRLLYGGRISLFAGLLGAGLSVAAGMLLGGIAGFYGGWIDDVIMRGGELFLALPWLYLLLAVRAGLPLHLPPVHAFFLIVTVLGLVGWARPARLIRGAVLSGKTRDYVLAARSAGATDAYLLRRHVLPQVLSIALTQAAVLVPQYTLAEVTLSFFGLGVGEPMPSWGNMLSALQRYDVLASYWWMFLPGIALIPVFLLYYALTDTLHERPAATR